MLMESRNFIQIIISFILLTIAITIFKLLNLDVSFIIMFIFGIFTLTVSVFFFMESNKIMITIKEKVTSIEKEVTFRTHKSIEKIEVLRPLNEKKNLNILGSLIKQDIKRRL